MPILDKPRLETFAQELALGANQADAYERAGYKRDDGHASRLAGDGRITARVEELQRDAAKLVMDRVALSRAEVIALLISDREEARCLASGHASALPPHGRVRKPRPDRTKYGHTTSCSTIAPTASSSSA